MSALAEINLKEIIKPFGDVIDQFVTNKEERANARIRMVEAMGGFYSRLYEAQRDTIVSEAQSSSWITRNWRPLTMLVFTSIVANNYIISPYLNAMFGWSVHLELPPHMWDLLKIGLGGYVVSRGAEKISENLKRLFDKPRRRRRRNDDED